MTRHAIKNSGVLQVRDAATFERYRPQLAAMMQMYGDRWGERPDFPLAESLENLAASLPHVWFAVENDTLLGVASLTDEVPGRHVYMHGLTHPAFRKHPAIDRTIRAVFAYAFEQLDALKVRAECLPTHWGARGFCRRYGFRLEARLREDRLVADYEGRCVLSDVLLYALYRNRFYTDQKN